jgi:drug/metabolite transporter (DMT)-like permease
MMKKYGQDADPNLVNFFGMMLGAACLLAMSALVENWSAVIWTPSNVVSIAYLSVFGSVIAFSAYYYLIKRMDATLVSLSTLIIPIVALALGHAFLDETVTPRALAGIATIVAGVAVAIVPSTLDRAPRTAHAGRDAIGLSEAAATADRQSR